MITSGVCTCYIFISSIHDRDGSGTYPKPGFRSLDFGSVMVKWISRKLNKASLFFFWPNVWHILMIFQSADGQRHCCETLKNHLKCQKFDKKLIKPIFNLPQTYFSSDFGVPNTSLPHEMSRVIMR